jgi:hypothetical protein
MADRLRDILTRVADRAGPVSVDPLLWSKAARSRRRRQALAAAAAGLVVAALVGGSLLATGVFRTAQPPVDRPDRHNPIEIEGIAGDGGLRLEKDLSIGRASVAMANDTNAFVVTASDGVPHRIALPGFDPSLYTKPAEAARPALADVLSLSPDGTKLIYAWHEPFVDAGADGRLEPGEGWVQSGARLLDLTTGTIDTYPSEPDEMQLSTQLSRSNWGFRWSPNSQLVAFCEGIGSPGSITEAWGGRVLDTTQKVAWSENGQQLNPRGVGEIPADPEYGAAPVVSDTGMAAWVETPILRGQPQYQEQSLMIGGHRVPRPHPLPEVAIWGSGRFSPDGQMLLVEPAGRSDRVLAVVPSRADRARQFPLTGDLPSEQVRIELLGWVDPDHVVAAVHQASGARQWQPDADLALLTLDLDTETADLTVIGRLDAVETFSAFSIATDPLAIDIPIDESEKPGANNPAAATDPTETSTSGQTRLTDRPWLAPAAAAIVFVAAALGVMILRRKRT